MLSDEDRAWLAEVDAREKAATPGPWRWVRWPETQREDVLAHFARHHDFGAVATIDGVGIPAPGLTIEEHCLQTAITGNGPTSEANAIFIADARTDIPRMRALIDRLVAYAKHLEDEHAHTICYDCEHLLGRFMDWSR